MNLLSRLFTKYNIYTWFVPCGVYILLSGIAISWLFAGRMPGHTIDWLVPDTKPQILTFANDAHYLWWDNALGFFDYYAFDRPLQLFGALTLQYAPNSEVVVVTWFFVIMIVDAISNYALCRSFVGTTNGTKTKVNFSIIFSCFVGGWLFAFGPLRFNMMMSGELFSFEISYMLLPIALLLIKSALTSTSQGSWIFVFLSAFVNWLVSSNIEFFVFLIFLAIVYALTIWREKISLKKLLGLIGLTGFCMAPSISVIFYALEDISNLTKYSVPSIQQELATWPYVRYPFEAVLLAGYPWNFFLNSLKNLEYIWYVAAAAFVGFVFLSVLTRKKAPIINFVLSIFVVILATGYLSPWPLTEITRIFYSVPIFAVVFQDPVYWMFLLPILYSIMLAYSVNAFLEWQRKNKKSLRVIRLPLWLTPLTKVTCIILLIGLFTYPLFAGSYTNYLGAFETSPTLQQFQNQISQDNTFYRVLYIPVSSAGTFIGTPYQTASIQIPNYPTLYGRNPDISYSPKRAVDASYQTYGWSETVAQQIVSAAGSNDTTSFNYLIQSVYAKYVVVLKDFVQPEYFKPQYSVSGLIAWLENDPNLWMVNQSSTAAIFENRAFASTFYFNGLVQETLYNNYSNIGASDEESIVPSHNNTWNVGALKEGMISSISSNGTIYVANSGPFDIYELLSKNLDLSSYWGLDVKLATSTPDASLTVAMHYSSNSSDYTSYEFVGSEKNESTTFYVPFAAFSQHGIASNQSVNFVDLIFSSANWIIYKIGFVKQSSNDPPIGSLVEVNPTLYEGQVKSSSSFVIVLPQSYDPNWQLQITNANNGSRVNLGERHILALGYANGWYIATGGNYSIKMVFFPQEVYNYLLYVPFVTLFLGFVIVILKVEFQNITRILRNNAFDKTRLASLLKRKTFAHDAQ